MAPLLRIQRQRARHPNQQSLDRCGGIRVGVERILDFRQLRGALPLAAVRILSGAPKGFLREEERRSPIAADRNDECDERLGGLGRARVDDLVHLTLGFKEHVARFV